jgi:hypothetical protein
MVGMQNEASKNHTFDPDKKITRVEWIIDYVENEIIQINRGDGLGSVGWCVNRERIYRRNFKACILDQAELWSKLKKAKKTQIQKDMTEKNYALK